MTHTPYDWAVIDAQVVRLRAEKLVAGGDALARLDDGRVAFVEGAIPGNS